MPAAGTARVAQPMFRICSNSCNPRTTSGERFRRPKSASVRQKRGLAPLGFPDMRTHNRQSLSPSGAGLLKCVRGRSDQTDGLSDRARGGIMRRLRSSAGRQRTGVNLVVLVAGVGILGALASPSRTLAETPVTRTNEAASRTLNCVDCHHFNAVLSHPTGIAPSMTTPASLPLASGTIDCVTCHDAPADHQSGSTKVGVRGGANGLCLQCHTVAEKFGHAAVRGMPAHLKSDSQRSASLNGMDAESAACLSCHDGAMASAGDVRLPGLDLQATHPVGVRARLDAPSNSDSRLVDVAGVDGRVRLFGKAVGCGSCHSVYSRAGRLLVMSNAKSRLCLSCHVE